MYKVGVANGQPYVSYKFLYGQKGGTLTFVAPQTPGDYEFRMFLNNTWVYLGKSNTVTVTSVSITASPTTVSSGQTITVTFSGAPGNQKDFIAMYKVGVPNGQPYVSYKYLNGQKSGTLTFTAPATAGDYEFRMFLNNTWVYLGKSNTVKVIQTQTAEWTIMVYMAGDNSLSSCVIDDLIEMETVGSTDRVKILAFADMGVGNAGIYYINKGSHSLVKNLGSVDSGFYQILVDFIRFSKENYPAQRYALILWDHGAGWRSGIRGICFDDSTGNFITLPELRQALFSSGIHFDLLGMDACLMGMIEVAHEIRSCGQVLVFSEASIPADGWDYGPILSSLTSFPSQSTQELSHTIIDSYFDYYGRSSNITLSAVNLSQINSLSAALSHLADHIMTDQSTPTSVYRNIGWYALYMDTSVAYQDYTDIGDFMNKLIASSQVQSQEVKNAATNVLSTLGNLVIANEAHGSFSSAQGVSIYFPYHNCWNFDKGNYTSLQFAQDTSWNELFTYLSLCD